MAFVHACQRLGTGLPNVVVTSLALATDDQELFAGTYGRSVFSINIATVPCPGDIDGDGVVSVVDLLTLLAAWGPNPGHPADLDDDGNVGVTDLLILLSAWGPCP